MIGYCGPIDKWNRMNWDQLVEYFTSKGEKLVYIDLDRCIDEQGSFKTIIHKMTYMMRGHDMNADIQLKNLYNYIKAHPGIRFIDDLDSVAITLDREELNSAITAIEWPESLKMNVPRAAMLLKSDPETIEETIKYLRFPLLAKPKSACSTSQSHNMRLVSSPVSLVGMQCPVLLQEYINHGGIVYKNYTIGDILEVGARPSTRDIKEGEEIVLDFHSQKSSENNGLWDKPADLDKIVYPIHDFQNISEILKNNLKMQLIGFDILIDHNGGYWLVDLNYFPGYKNVENLWEKFYHFLNKDS